MNSLNVFPELLRDAVERLGPERCRRALPAFTHAPPPDHRWTCAEILAAEPWRHCLLAYAYGAPGELQALMGDHPSFALAASALELRHHDVAVLCGAFDAENEREALLLLVQAQAQA